MTYKCTSCINVSELIKQKSHLPSFDFISKIVIFDKTRVAKVGLQLYYITQLRLESGELNPSHIDGTTKKPILLIIFVWICPKNSVSHETCR